jgi:hypothetical protein
VLDLEAEADTLVDRLWTLTEELQNAPPTRMRELVHQMVPRIDLRFDRKQQGRRTIYPFAGGKVYLRPDPVLYRLVNRGDWTPIELFATWVEGLPSRIRHMIAAA